MANYTSLKATIDANIKANGRQEITGTILNAVLKAAVDTIGDGYRFVGVVTPTSEAPVSDNRIFVFASTAGTYTNFGLSVASGELCVFYFDTIWHKAVISTGGGGGVDAYTKAETNALLAAKQNASDNSLQTTDKTIVGAINENKGDIDGKYTKPSGGIPATDMASAVQTSLGKADTALQSQEQADWNETDTTDPAYIKNKPTIPTLPTIATGINTQSTNTEVAGAKAVYDYHDASKADKIGVSTALPADGALLANTFYDIATLSGEMTLSCAAAVGYAEYMLKFSTGGTAPTITWSGITWASGSAPTIAANKTYEVNVLDGVAIFVEY